MALTYAHSTAKLQSSALGLAAPCSWPWMMQAFRASSNCITHTEWACITHTDAHRHSSHMPDTVKTQENCTKSLEAKPCNHAHKRTSRISGAHRPCSAKGGSGWGGEAACGGRGTATTPVSPSYVHKREGVVHSFGCSTCAGPTKGCNSH